MLIKIDHVCYTTNKGKGKNIIEANSSYNIVFKEENLINLDIKQGKSRCTNVVHDIIYLESEERIPIEITEYSNIEWGENGPVFNSEISTLYVPTDNLQNSIEFFEFCGAKIDEKSMTQAKGRLKGLFDKITLNIELNLVEQRQEWILDREGVCCLALVVNDIEKERVKWLERYNATDIRKLEVNGRKLKIFFGVGKCGETIEVISL